jgi:hypothetical protein
VALALALALGADLPAARRVALALALGADLP